LLVFTPNDGIDFTAPQNMVYDGNGKVFSASSSVPCTFSLSYTGTGNTVYGPSSDAPVGAGSYIVTARSTDARYSGGRSENFTISKAVLLIQAITLTPPENLAYNAEEKVFSASSPNVTGFSLSYEGRNSTVYAASSTAPKNAGEYRVTATSTDPNRSGSRRQDFTITKAGITVTADHQSKIYGQPDPELTYSHSPLWGSDVLVGGLSRIPGENAGVYGIGLGEMNSDNYEISYQSANLTIQKATLVPVWSGATSVVFDGNPHTLTASTIPATTVSVTYSGSTTAPTQVGTYAVVATVLDDNYEGTASSSLEIQAKSIESWAAESGLTGADAAPTADPDGDGLDNRTEFAFGTSPSGVGSSEICKVLPAGEGTLAVGFLRRVSGAEASYQARVFTDLSTGFSGGTNLTPVRSADQTGVPPGYERVEVQAPTTGTRGFIQIQAEVP
jgi:hypothetical protein